MSTEHPGHALAIVPATGASLPATADLSQEAIREQLEKYAKAARGAYAKNTEKAIRCDTAVFLAWCQGRGASHLPADPETVAAFIDAMGESRAVATVRRYLASIAHIHRAAKLPDPTKDDGELVKLAIRRLVRVKGTRQRQAAPLNRGAIDKILGSLGDTPRDLRDAALLAIAYDTLCRRSELCAFDIEHVQIAEEGSGTVLIARSKTDQEGAGMVRFLAADTIERLRKWLAIVDETKGPLFRALRGGKVGNRLAPDDVSRIYKRAAKSAGVSEEGISGHSTRVGASQDITQAGFGLAELMQAGGWKTAAMPARYGEHLQARRGAMAKLAALQNRA